MCCSLYLAAISLEPVKTSRRLHAPFNEHDNGICSRMCQGALFAVVNHEVVRARSSRASAPRDRLNYDGSDDQVQSNVHSQGLLRSQYCVNRSDDGGVVLP